MGPDGRSALQDIRGVAADVDRAILNGAYRRAAARFVDYWNGVGAWAAMPPERQDQILRYLPKAGLDFRALIDESMPLVAFRRLRIPLLLMQGEHTVEPARLITQKLVSFMQPAAFLTVSGAGHMGPLSHAETVVEAIAGHLRSVAPHVGMTHGRRDTMRYAA
jgi:pimeloyl-ACP methyl ester carboxylesterase